MKQSITLRQEVSKSTAELELFGSYCHNMMVSLKNHQHLYVFTSITHLSTDTQASRWISSYMYRDAMQHTHKHTHLHNQGRNLSRFSTSHARTHALWKNAKNLSEQPQSRHTLNYPPPPKVFSSLHLSFSAPPWHDTHLCSADSNCTWLDELLYDCAWTRRNTKNLFCMSLSQCKLHYDVIIVIKLAFSVGIQHCDKIFFCTS